MTQVMVGPRTAWSGRTSWAGVLAGPVFCSLVILQSVIRPGFDFTAMPLSLLALGDLGWIQTLNFFATGALIIISGVAAFRHPRGGAWLAAPVILYGLGMLSAGIFKSDPIAGFPVGSHPPAAISQHATLHGYSFGVAQLALSAAGLVAAVRSWRESRLWAVASLATCLLGPGLVVLGFVRPDVMGLAFFATALVALSWLAVLNWRLLHQDADGTKPIRT